MLLADVLTGGQIEDLLAVEVRIEVEVKTFQGFGGIERPSAQAQNVSQVPK